MNEVADVAVASTAVDMTALVEAVFGLLGAALLGLATFAVNWVRGRIGLDKMTQDDIVRKYLMTAIDNGLGAAIRKIAGADGQITVDIENQIVREVVRYLKDRVPDALTRFNFTDDAIAETVAGRLDRYLLDRKV